MILIQQRRLLALAICAGLGAGASPASALTNLSYTYFQDGYSEGATVTGAFSGNDLDGNGLLINFPSGPPPVEFQELTSWTMHFSGNALSPAFDLTLDDLYGFVYEIGSAGIGDDPAFEPTLNRNLIEGIGAFSADHFYSSGLGPNQMIGGFVGAEIDFSDLNNLAAHALDTSENLALVTLVPEPASITLLIAAGVVVGAMRPERRAPARR